MNYVLEQTFGRRHAAESNTRAWRLWLSCQIVTVRSQVGAQIDVVTVERNQQGIVCVAAAHNSLADDNCEHNQQTDALSIVASSSRDKVLAGTIIIKCIPVSSAPSSSSFPPVPVAL